MTIYQPKRTAAAILGALAVVGSGVGPARAQSPEEVRGIIADRAAAHGQSIPYLTRVAECESRLDIRAIGQRGEQGLYQLLPGGELTRFYSYGYDDPWSAWQQADFTARRFSEGGARAWSCA